jgi:hypothetical protein
MVQANRLKNAAQEEVALNRLASRMSASGALATQGMR